MWKLAFVGLSMICLSLLSCAESTTLGKGEAQKITKEELRSVMDDPNLVIIDVRSSHDWPFAKLKIKGAVRENPEQVGRWVEKYPRDKTLVFY